MSVIQTNSCAKKKQQQKILYIHLETSLFVVQWPVSYKEEHLSSQ